MILIGDSHIFEGSWWEMDIARVASHTLRCLTNIVLRLCQRGNVIVFELTHLLVADRNAIAESGLQDLQTFWLGWKLCVDDAGSKSQQHSCAKIRYPHGGGTLKQWKD
jgi:hypothetical protein